MHGQPARYHKPGPQFRLLRSAIRMYSL